MQYRSTRVPYLCERGVASLPGLLAVVQSLRQLLRLGHSGIALALQHVGLGAGLSETRLQIT